MSENAENKQNEKQILPEKESEVDEELNTLLESLYHFLLLKWQIVALMALCYRFRFWVLRMNNRENSS